MGIKTQVPGNLDSSPDDDFVGLSVPNNIPGPASLLQGWRHT